MARPGGPELTPGEWRVLALVARGARNGEIAAALGITLGTVSARMTIIYQHLGLTERADKRALAARWYLASRGEPRAGV